MKHKLLSIVLIVALLVSILVPRTAEAKEYAIKDVEESDDAYQDIQDVLNQGWMSLTLSKFLPDKCITREEFALILTKLNSQLSEAKTIKKVSFKDVTLKGQYGKYIELQKSNIPYYKTSKGKYFKPKNYLTREDALVSIVKALGYDTDDAIDGGVDSEVSIDELIEDYSKISSALETYVAIGVTNELINLIEDGDKTYLYPKKSITRRQMAQLLVKANDARDFEKDITTGDSDEVTIDDSDETEEITSESSTDNDSDNNSSNTDKSTTEKSTTDKSTSEDGLGYLKIELNGKEMAYKPKTTEELGSYWSFYSDKYSTNNVFHIELPTDIETGDSITIDSTTDNDILLYYPMSVQYVNAKGDCYIFGYPYGHSGEGIHASSKITIMISSKEGSGGYVTGTINAEIVLKNGEVITFTNGAFKYKLKDSGF